MTAAGLAAVTALNQAAARDPRNADNWLKLGAALQAQRNLDAALASFRNAAAVQPSNASAHAAIGALLLRTGKFAEAADSLTTALAHDARSPGVAFNRALAFGALGKLDLATADYERAFAIDPSDRRLLASFVGHLHRRHDDAAAEAVIERARPITAIGAQVALANLRADQMRNDEALTAFQAALDLDPTDPSAHWSRSLVLLRMGNLRDGFREFEHRLDGFVETAGRVLPGPEWNPASAQSAQKILLYAEQGLGDTIQFIRLAKLVQSRGRNVALLPPRALARLCRTLDPNIAVLSADQPLPRYDAHCSLMSLPAKLGTELATIPSKTPYLHVDEASAAHWRARIAHLSGTRIGLCWSGSATHAGDALRSVALNQMRTLTDVPGVSFVSLQKDVRPSDREALLSNEHLLDVMSEISDLHDTAALITALDLVITVDTSIAHLVGALGKPVWILLPFAPDWRWLTAREDSPWYPTARLFRQDESRTWEPVLARVAARVASGAR